MQRLVLLSSVYCLRNNGCSVKHFSQTIKQYQHNKINEEVIEILKKSAYIESNDTDKVKPSKKHKDSEHKKKKVTDKELEILKSKNVNVHDKKLTKYIDPSLKKTPHLTIKKGMSLNQLANLMSRQPKQLANHIEIIAGVRLNYNSSIHSIDLILRLVKACGYKPILQNEESVGKKDETLSKSNNSEDLVPLPPDPPESCKPRPPVVTIMGHVDHGKTTLLDSLRSSRIVDQEFGGITQHIGAFTVKLADSNLPVVFLDTPGHAAFTAMRERGSNCTDLVVLVVAADDGVMPQTVESIRMAKQAGTPIIVAINKIDKTESNIEQIKLLLSTHGVVVEDVGGDVQCVPISALKSINLDKLQEAILTQAEVMELKASHTVPVHGVVLESYSKQGIGKVGTILVQRGILKIGDYLVAGTALCKVRTMENDLGESVTEITPGYPAIISGWKDLPSAGDTVLQANSLQHANNVIRKRLDTNMNMKAVEDHNAYQDRMSEYNKAYKNFIQKRNREAKTRRSRISLSRRSEDLSNLIELGDSDDVPKYSLVIRADVDGSIEAIIDLLSTYHSHDVCKLDIIDFGVGPPTISDVQKAEDARGFIYLFNVEAPSSVREAAEEAEVEIRFHNVIYNLADDVKSGVTDRLLPVYEEVVLGEAEVLQMFSITESKKKVWVAGCRCTTGNMIKNQLFKVLRFRSPPHPDVSDSTTEEGSVQTVLADDLSCISLKNKKLDVETIKRDTEFGIRLDFSDHDAGGESDENSKKTGKKEESVISEGDLIICYKVVQKQRTLTWDFGF